MAMVGAVTPLTDIGLWVRSSGLQIVLFVTGAMLVTRFATWLGRRITVRIDRQAGGADSLVRSEAAKHRHAVAQVVTWSVLVLVYCLTAVLVTERLGLPLSGFVAPATVVGVALGFGAQRIVQDVLAGFFMVTERQYGFGDLVRLNVTSVVQPVTGISPGSGSGATTPARPPARPHLQEIWTVSFFCAMLWPWRAHPRSGGLRLSARRRPGPYCWRPPSSAW